MDRVTIRTFPNSYSYRDYSRELGIYIVILLIERMYHINHTAVIVM